MLRRILVPLDPTAYSASAVKYACQLAKAHEATITLMMVLDEPGIEKAMGPASPGAFKMAEKAEKRLEQDIHEQIQVMLKNYGSKCDDEGVKHETLEVQGTPSEMIIEHSRFFDLVIMGLVTHFNFATSEENDDTLDEILGKMPAALLAVPDNFVPLKDHMNVVLAFDASDSATRSVREFTQVAAFSNPNMILVNSNSDMEKSKEITEPARRYLEAYNYTDIEEVWTPDDIEVIMKEIYLESADLFVVGIHAKRRLFDHVIGSSTQFFIKEANKPVFMGH